MEVLRFALLGLGIGANAAMFTFLDTVFLRMPAGVVDPGGIRRLWRYHQLSTEAQFWPGFSYAQYDAVRTALGDRARTALYTAPWKVKIGLGESSGEAQFVKAEAGFFALTGARAEIGRLYDSTEDRLDGPQRVAVVSHDYWQRALNGDRSAIGKPIVIAGFFPSCCSCALKGERTGPRSATCCRTPMMTTRRSRYRTAAIG